MFSVDKFRLALRSEVKFSTVISKHSGVKPSVVWRSEDQLSIAKLYPNKAKLCVMKFSVALYTGAQTSEAKLYPNVAE